MGSTAASGNVSERNGACLVWCLWFWSLPVAPCLLTLSLHPVPTQRFKHKLKSELLALKKRIVSGKAEQKRQRQLDLERLLKRYENVKRELAKSQNLERIRAEKYARTRGIGL